MPNPTSRWPALSLAFALVFALPGARAAETGVTDGEIRIGTSTDLHGELKEYGLGSVEASKIVFDQANAKGGVHGRKIMLLTRDDGYRPIPALENTKRLVQEDKVFLLYGQLGTANIKAELPFIDSVGIPFFPLTGADLVHLPPRKHVFTLRANYHQEGDVLVAYVVSKIGLKEFGLIIQDDATGTSVRTGVTRRMQGLGLGVPKTVAVYSKESKDLGPAIEAMRKAKPPVVFFHGVPEVGVELARKLREGDYRPALLFTSLVGARVLQKELGERATNAYVAESLPITDDLSVPIVKEYREQLKKSGVSRHNGFSIEGYVASKLIVAALERAGQALTRDSFVAALESFHDFDVGGFRVDFSPAQHQGLTSPFLYVIDHGTVRRAP